MLLVHSFPLGPIQANCHILHDDETNRVVVVDPGDEAVEILAFLKRLNVTVEAIWNTHGHIDHINANAPLQQATKAPLYIHQAVAEWLGSALLCGATWCGIPHVPSKADKVWKDGDIIKALDRSWLIHHAPGHSPGCSVIVCQEERLVVAGDVLFRDSIGRMDLPGGSPTQMTQSLRSLFNEWCPGDWRVLCGHGDETTIDRERRANQLVREALTVGFETA